MPTHSHPWDDLGDQVQAELRRDAEAIAPRLFGGVPADMVKLPEGDLLRRFRQDWPNPEQRQWWLRAFGPVQFLAMWRKAWKDATPAEIAAATAPPPLPLPPATPTPPTPGPPTVAQSDGTVATAVPSQPPAQAPVVPMARGGTGVVTEPTVFVGGEQGPEAFWFEPLTVSTSAPSTQPFRWIRPFWRSGLLAGVAPIPDMQERLIRPKLPDVRERITPAPLPRQQERIELPERSLVQERIVPVPELLRLQRERIEEPEELQRLRGTPLTVIPPSEALQQPGGTSVPDDPAFRQAVVAARGQVDSAGIRLPLWRQQTPQQSGQRSARTGVYYAPSAEAVEQYGSQGTTEYGGSEAITGDTVLRRPLVVQGAAGGAVQNKAVQQLVGEQGMYALWRRVLAVEEVANQYGGVDYLYMFPEGQAAVRTAITQQFKPYGIDEDESELFAATSTVGTHLRSALFERVTAELARQAGYDSIIGYQPTQNGAVLTEIYDLRESHYPTPEGGYQIRPEFVGTGAPAHAAGV